ncbi:MAG: hypothetical protein ACKO5F_14220 [Synechococcus sp.]
MNKDRKNLIERAKEFARPFRIHNGESFRLRDVDPGDTLDLDQQDKPRAAEALAQGVELLAEQGLLKVCPRRSLLHSLTGFSWGGPAPDSCQHRPSRALPQPRI